MPSALKVKCARALATLLGARDSRLSVSRIAFGPHSTGASRFIKEVKLNNHSLHRVGS